MKKLLFGVVFFVVMLLALEFLLSFAGLEKHDHRFMPTSSYPIFVPGKGDLADHYVTNPHFGSYINKQSFLKAKSAGLIRIFVVGGSAAYGFPYTEEYGFSGYLRRSLDKAAPGRFEIINGAGMSFGSHRVLDVLRDVVLFEPDIVIIYSGNNEYVEQNILPEIKAPPASVEKISTLVNDTHLYRAVRLGLFKTAPEVFARRIKQDITDIRTDPQVHRGNIGRSPHTDEAILANYRQNITSMKELLARHGVPGIFCTVPVDIGGWLPESGVPQFADEAAAGSWLELLDKHDEAFASGDIAGEGDYLRQILAITPNDPGMLFNYGKVLWSLGKYQDSYQELIKAKDADYRPVRGLSSFNRILRTMADEPNGFFVADLEDKIKEKFIQGQAAGIFLDYCHLTETGHKLVAKWLLPALAEVVKAAQLDIPELSGMIDADPRAETKNDFVRGHELYAQAMTFENNGRFDLAEKYYLDSLRYLPRFDHSYTNLGHIYADQNDFSKAKEMYDKALQINPRNHQVNLSLGYLSIREERFDQAEKFFVQAISITPDLPGAYSGLGDVAMRRGEYRQAVKYYHDSLRLGEDNEWLRKSLAQAYLSLGDSKNAVRNWQKALAYTPFDQEIRTLVEQYSPKK